MVKVLFVCLGNICRSPTAEGVFQTLLEQEGLSGEISVDSAGTGSWHVGSPPDRRAQAAARRRGIDLSGQRARQAKKNDFSHFDYIIAMDTDNHDQLSRLCPPGDDHKLFLFLDFAPELNRRDVPDPYYGADGGFEGVLDMIGVASEGLLAHIRENHL